MVIVDLAYMKIVNYNQYFRDDWAGSTGIFNGGGSFYLNGFGDNLYGSWTWAKLLIHCEGPGSSAIRFDQDPGENSVEIFDTKTYVLEFEEPIVDQREGFSVGGIIMPANTLVILAPYLTLVGLVATVSTVYLVKQRKKK